MSRVGIDLDFRGVAEVQAMLSTLDERQIQNRTRRALRASGAVFRKRMRAAGAMGWPRRPRSFRKTRTRSHRFPLGLSVNPASALSSIFEHGARPHGIPIGAGPSAGRTVHHPGVAARPFIVPVFEAAKGEAENAFADGLFEGIR